MPSPLADRQGYRCSWHLALHQRHVQVRSASFTSDLDLVPTLDHRGKAFYDPILPNSNVTNGDFLGTLFMMITASFAWELAYRTKISPVSLLHHSAAICLAAWQLACVQSTLVCGMR